MAEKPDIELLREYAEYGSEAAFGELVARHTDLVYSAALRQAGFPDLARDVAQSVFTDLARKARALSRAWKTEAPLVGWLYRSTRYAVLNELRNVRRRQARERLVMTDFNAPSETAAEWERVWPALDEAMTCLSEPDREALLLRFFKNQDFRAIGAALRISDDTAQKRVARGLEKLRRHLVRQGVTTSSAVLPGVLAANAVQIAPGGLSASLAAASLAGAASTTATLSGFLQLMATTKLKITVAGALIVAGIVTPMVLQHQKDARQNRLLQEANGRLGELQAENARLSNIVATAKAPPPDEPSPELLALRREVAGLRTQLREKNRPGATPLAGDPAASDDTAGPKGFVPSETWTNAGFSTPLDALLTEQWAVHTANIDKYKESIVITPEARKFLDDLSARMLSNAPPEMVAEIKKRGYGVEEAILFPMVAQDQTQGYKGYRVLQGEMDSPDLDEVSFKIGLEMRSGDIATNAMRFKKFGADWKQVIDLSDLPDDVRNTSPAP